MAGSSKETVYGDTFSNLGSLVSLTNLTTQWDTDTEVLWGQNEYLSNGSYNTEHTMATSADMLARKHRQDSEPLTSREDESDGDLNKSGRRTVPERSNTIKPKSLSVDLPSPSFESDVDEASLMRDPHQDTTSQSVLREDVSNGHQTPSGRAQVNGHSPSRPNSISSTPRNGDKSLNSSQNKKKSSNWFSLSYKQKCDEFHKLFKDIPADERLLVDYSCAMQKDILVHGRLYISQNWICFYANILFKWETTVMIPCKEIKSITKEKTARVIPNAIQVNTPTDKFFFSSFSSRDKAYLLMFRVWQNTLMDQLMTNQQLWQWVHDLNGSQLGLTESDDDYPLPVQDFDNPQTPDVSSIAGSEEAVVSNGVSTSAARHLSTLDVEGAVSETGDVTKLEMSSDCTDSTESEDACDEGEVECPAGHDHSDWVTLDLLVNFSVDQVLDLLFTDSTFFAAFLNSQGTSDIVLGEWSEQPDADGVKHRNNSFTIAVNASFGPKSTPSTEKQYMRKESKPGTYYCIDCESFTDPSLPYGDNFYVWNRYCISRVTRSTCRVVVHSKICYIKSIFALVKAIIEKNVRNGINSYFKPLSEVLTHESDKMASNVDQPRKKKRYVKHRAASIHNRNSSHPSNGAVHGTKTTVSRPQPAELHSSRKTAYITSTVRVMSALLIFLVMFNLLLFFKLWSLETRHAAMQFDNTNSGMYSHQELLDLLNKQKFLYEKDMNHWKSTLESSTKLIHELQESIEEIKTRQADVHPTDRHSAHTKQQTSTKSKPDL